jgi:hypothetical protein
LQEFEEMTPKEFRIYTEVFAEKAEQDSNEKLTLTWLGAYWQRGEKLEPLENYLRKKEPEKPQEMTTDQMLAKVLELNAKMGGTTVTPGGD